MTEKKQISKSFNLQMESNEILKNTNVSNTSLQMNS